jgi:hypothetical protein
MKKETRIYIVDGNTIDFDFKTELLKENYDIIISEAEREGRVYSLQGFQDAFNSGDEFSADVDYILIH